MKYEVEIFEERAGDAQKMADALYLLFDVSVKDIVKGPNGNPLLLVDVPEESMMTRSFKLWLMERPSLASETEALLAPILAEADEVHGLTDEQYEKLREV